MTLRIALDTRVLEQHSAPSPLVVGTDLAQQVNDYVHRERLGYYPALEFIEAQNGADGALLAAVDHIAWLAAQLVRNEIEEKLRPVFASLKIRGMQCAAYAMPPIRPRWPNALETLAKHYTPNIIKIELQVSVIQRRENAQGLQRHARQMVSRWLKNSFDGLEVTRARLL